MKKQVLILPLLICGASAAWAAQQTPSKLVWAFNKSSKGINYGRYPRDYIYSEVRRVSPDHKYVACIKSGDGEVGYLRIYRYDKKSKKPLLKQPVSRVWSDVGGCVWVPKRPNYLAFSTGGYIDAHPQERGKIGLWTSKSTRVLKRAKSSNQEGFNIRAISADGRFLIYEHFGVKSPDPNHKRNTYLKLVLPQK